MPAATDLIMCGHGLEITAIEVNDLLHVLIGIIIFESGVIIHAAMAE